MKIRWILRATVLAGVTLFAGCRTHGTVLDLTGNQIRLSHLDVDPQGNLTIRQGATVRTVSLDEISSIELYPDDIENAGGRLFYRAEVVLANGDIVPAKARDRRDKQTEPKAYVHIDSEIVGQSNKGVVRIALRNVQKLVIE